MVEEVLAVRISLVSAARHSSALVVTPYVVVVLGAWQVEKIQ